MTANQKTSLSEKYQLEKLNMLEQIADMVVHDMRNPLSSIKMGLTTLMNRSNPEERDRTFMEIMVKEVENLEDILKNLLDIAKPQNLRLSQTNINQVVNQALDRTTENFGEREIKIEKTLNPDLPPVQTDKDRLLRAISALIMNAGQSIEKSGTIRIQSNLDNETSQLKILIQDDGEGIPSENINQVFDPFFSTRPRGRGLGLTYVKNTINAHKGQLKIESDGSKGTAITLYLPVQ